LPTSLFACRRAADHTFAPARTSCAAYGVVAPIRLENCSNPIQPLAVPDILEIATRHFFFDPVFRAYTRRLQKIRAQNLPLFPHGIHLAMNYRYP
jgi:hypothetical protein